MQTPAPGLDAATPVVKFTQTDLARFWAKVDKNGALPDQSNPHYSGLDKCWTWNAASRRYGVFSFGGRMTSAHRISWMIAYGSITDRLHVLHRCDNGICVNPSHLWLGSHEQNMRDKTIKRRDAMAFGDSRRLIPIPDNRGERNPNAKLSESDVRSIRIEFSRGGVSHCSLARKYGVVHSFIGAILRREKWKHVD